MAPQQPTPPSAPAPTPSTSDEGDERDSTTMRGSIDQNSNDVNVEDDEEEDDYDEEEECRVCRGPAEPDLPLYHPCRCSGSIGLVHQECLVGWLSSSTRPAVGEKCELCGTPFIFEPRYADGTPDALPPYEVVLGIVHRAYGRWLPLVARVAAAAALWLGVLPLATAYLYYGWIHRPAAVAARWRWEYLAGDAVSGAVVSSVIVVSFLSLMSFADFMRFQWQRQEQEAQHQRQEEEEGQDRADVDPAGVRDEIDDDALEEDLNHDQGILRRNAELEEDEIVEEDRTMFLRRDIPLEDEEEDLMEEEGEEENGVRGFPNEGPLGLNFQRRNNRFEPQFEPIAPLRVDPDNGDDREGEEGGGNREGDDNVGGFIADEDMNMEIHLALDELLGLRGPLLGLVRNLLWFLAFNTTYLGLFAFIPHAVGGSVYHALSKSNVLDRVLSLQLPGRLSSSVNRLAPDFIRLAVFHNPEAELTTAVEGDSAVDIASRGDLGGIIRRLLASLHAESLRRNVVLRLPDVATIVLGYLTMALMVFVWQFVAAAAMKVYKTEDDALQDQQQLLHPPAPPVLHGEEDEGDEAMAGLVGDDEMEDVAGPGNVADSFWFSTALNCAAAIVKVGVLLFLKMLLLPLFLGIGLDVATLALFDTTAESRVLYAGGDLFGAALLHWVVGITFMLLVTVSVLQLREVAHPGLFAKVIRPQEPQPDLLGNLLQESGATHAKRMLVSLGIYVALLAVHVWFPAQILVALRLGPRCLPFARPRLFHLVLPQLQVPIELLAFHLSMLAFLEKYKNCIGKLQHQWLKYVCCRMGLTEHILPRTVKGFALVGSRPICMEAVKCLTATSMSTSLGTLGDVSKENEDENQDGTSKMMANGDPRSDAVEAGTVETSSNGTFSSWDEMSSLPEVAAQTWSMLHSPPSVSSSQGPVRSSLPETTRADSDESKSDISSIGHQQALLKSSRPPTTGAIMVDSFWRELAFSKKPPSHNFIISNLETVAAADGKEDEEHAPPPKGDTEPNFRGIYVSGVTRRNGKRVLPNWEAFIQLPDAEGTVLPGSIASYRLRVLRERRGRCVPNLTSDGRQGDEEEGEEAQCDDASPRTTRKRPTTEGVAIHEGTRIEIWREVPGGTISRPPEGWDDLDIGGAEVQGRWAWGKEKRSKIEESVAHRAPFFGGETGNRYLIATKIVALLLMSWLAILVTACAAVSCPLMLGRAVFALVSIPEAYAHDPMAFAIGVGVLVPLINSIGRHISLKGGHGNFEQCSKLLRTMTSQFRFSQCKGKVHVVLASMGIWVFLVPMALGIIYELCVVRGQQWWAGGIDVEFGSITTLSELAKTWGAGLMFIHIWAALCYYNVFGRKFWSNIGIGVLDGDDNGADDEHQEHAVSGLAGRTVGQKRAWQGNDGRITHFARSIYAVLFNSEWDKVDRVVLIDECARPVAVQLLVTLLGPLFLYFCQHCLFFFLGRYSANTAGVVLPFFGFIEKGVYRMMAYRTCAAIVVTFQLAVAFQDGLYSWFTAAHKAARDDRYLVGKTLKNFNRPT